MILRKKFDCTTDDLDSVIVSLAKEIEDGWHIGRIELHDIHMCYMTKKNESDFSIELVRKDGY